MVVTRMALSPDNLGLLRGQGLAEDGGSDSLRSVLPRKLPQAVGLPRAAHGFEAIRIGAGVEQLVGDRLRIGGVDEKAVPAALGNLGQRIAVQPEHRRAGSQSLE